VQALSGTGALRIAGDFLNRFYAHNKQIFVPTPTWANHIPLFTDAGLEVKYYRYYDKAANGLDWKGLIDDINSAPNKYLPLDSTTNSGALSALAPSPNSSPHSTPCLQVDHPSARLRSQPDGPGPQARPVEGTGEAHQGNLPTSHPVELTAAHPIVSYPLT